MPADIDRELLSQLLTEWVLQIKLHLRLAGPRQEAEALREEEGQHLGQKGPPLAPDALQEGEVERRGNAAHAELQKEVLEVLDQVEVPQDEFGARVVQVLLLVVVEEALDVRLELRRPVLQQGLELHAAVEGRHDEVGELLGAVEQAAGGEEAAASDVADLVEDAHRDEQPLHLLCLGLRVGAAAQAEDGQGAGDVLHDHVVDVLADLHVEGDAPVGGVDRLVGRDEQRRKQRGNPRAFWLGNWRGGGRSRRCS